MKRLLTCCSLLIQLSNGLFAVNTIPANHQYIQYYGRWDFSDSLAPTHSWPGVYLYAEFEGTSIGVRMNDNYCYYNVFIDGKLSSVFKGNSAGIASYTLASGLSDSTHTFLFTKRNETTSSKFSFNGLILDDGKNLLQPPVKPVRKIEFMGDSYTSASGNEWTDNTKPLEKENQYTNIFEGFGPITARNYNAQYQMTSQAGYGLVLDWQGNYTNNIPDKFDRTLCYTSLPKWDYEQWIPNLVVICLGLNDYSGFGGWSGPVAQDKTDLFKSRYHEFIATIRDVYPRTKILLVAAHVEWIQTATSEIVAEENNLGKTDVFSTYFPKYDDSAYVFGGHPTVATHHLIAERLIAAIDTINAWQPYQDLLPPRITKLPISPFTVYDTSYILSIQTDSYATMRYSTEDKPYDQMEHTFTTTGKRDHTVVLSCQHGIPYTYYVRGIDVYGNAMDSSAIVHFTVDTTKSLLHWNSFAYDHTAWKMGPSPLGSVNDGTIKTLLDTALTVYFRRTVTIDSMATITAFGLFVKGHNGAVVYVNGQELERINIFTNTEIGYSSLALSALVYNKMIVVNTPAGLSKFHNGVNSIAVEVHTSSAQGGTTEFDSYLIDNKTRYYYRLGSDWSYDDNWDTPADQLHDKGTSKVEEKGDVVPKNIVLYSNYPNPFNPSTTLKFDIPSKSHVTMNIFDLLGRKVATLLDEVKSDGMYSVQFNAGTLSSGMYFCRLQSGHAVTVSKLMLVK